LLIHKRDAWAKNQDLDPYEARRLYVDALLKVSLRCPSINLYSHPLPFDNQVLRKYSDKTIATGLVQELESYGSDPLNIAMNRKYAGESLVFVHHSL
jgi:hypothetical protein